MELRIDRQGPVCRRVNGVVVDTSTWATPDEGAFNPEVLRDYLSRKLAVTLYLDGHSDADIQKKSGIGKKQTYRLIRERCMAPAEDGRLYGWRGLVRYERLHGYQRKTKVRVNQFGHGAAGALTQVLTQHPEVLAGLERRITDVGPTKRLKAEKRTIASITRWFLEELRKLGYEERGEWPFNTDDLGYTAIFRFAKDLLSRSPEAATYIAAGEDAVKKLKTGDGAKRPVLSFLERVEMDAHKLDGLFCVVVPSPDGTEHERIVHRIWVVVILEVVSRAVLGYHLTFGKEVKKEDVLRAIKGALTRWQPRKISYSDHEYLPGSGLVSTLGPTFVGLCWNETSVDGALAETCESVRTTLREVVGATLLSPKTGFSSRHSKDDRPFIETFFRTLGERGFQKMSNTTGGNIKKRKYRKPEEVAVKSRFQIEYAEELLDVLIANYNATPHTAHNGDRSPLAQVKYLRERNPDKVRTCTEAEVAAHFSERKLCTVHGGGSSGKLPYVEFVHARYTNELLHGRFDLINKKIWVANHLEYDARVASASTQEGHSLGVLRAAPPWNQTPHSLMVRREIMQENRRRKFILLNGGDAVESFLDFVESQPNSRLPTHPAYLEARRILREAARSLETDSIREAALQRAPLETEEEDRPSSGISSGNQKNAERSLPPLRKAVFR